MKIYVFLLLLCITTSSVFAQSSVSINWSTSYQTMDGFGAVTNGSANQAIVTGPHSAMFFTTASGIGLSYMRSSSTSDGSIPDFPSLQAAVANGAKIFFTFSSPPASLKESGTFAQGAATSNGTCFKTSQSLTTSEAAYAQYIVSYIQMLQGSPNNIPIDTVSIQNEPDVGLTASNSNTTVGSCIMTAQAFHDVVGYLGPDLAAAGLTTKILLPENSEWFDQDYASTCLTDSNCAQYVSAIAGHGYEWSGGNTTIDGFGVGACCHQAVAPPSDVVSSGKHLWLTEVDGSGSYTNGVPNYDGTISDAMVWAHNIHDYLTVANVSAWFYWQLTAYSSSGDNFGLTDANFNPAKRYFALGNWSKFVRPGWNRIESTTNPQPGVYVSAFREASSGQFAIIAINQNPTPVNVSFSLSGFPAVASVTPTVTSASSDLVDQAVESVSNGAFSYALPATSVVTFHSTTSTTTSSSVPSAPTSLSVIVR
jgi:glucuronoarabinoxylan endo-1,4-beta-xylanase